MLAHFPHAFETWIWWGHTVPNGDPPEPFCTGTDLCGVMLASSLSLPEGFDSLEVSEDKVIWFLVLLPLFAEEMNFKLRRGAEKLADRLAAAGVSDVIDVSRTNTCRKRWGLF